jgi:hypothetical protein
MSINYIPPPIIHHVEDSRISYGRPYFYECDGRIINLSAATQFYVDHIPLTSFYWPCARIGGASHQLTASMSSKEDALAFLRELTKKIEGAAIEHN